VTQHPNRESNASRSRRDVLKMAAAAGVSALAGPAVTGCGAPRAGADLSHRPPLTTGPLEFVRIGFVGVGGMGANHVEHLLKVPGAQIRAVCDIVPEKVARVQDMVAAAGQPKPAGYSRGPRDFERMCEVESLDIVYNAAPWEWHVPICVAAMQSGKHAATEVPAAYTVDGCWELVETAEKHGRHCVMLENCCYDRAELMILHMVRKGLFGEVLHGECGYLHDLRDIKFSRDGEGLWRRAHATKRNGNFYPTHGLGPIAQCMDINRGDRFDYLVSMSGPSRGLQLWQNEHLDPDDPRRAERYSLGDVNLSLLRTVNGRTVYLVHDTNLPRPYSRIRTLQGTRGIVSGYPDRVHIEGRSPPHQWEPLENYAAEFEHPLWKTDSARSATAGHGGMDYLENLRLIKCLMEGRPPDMDVYDAATWSVICALSETSVAKRSRPIDFPDFTRGRWRTAPPVGIVEA